MPRKQPRSMPLAERSKILDEFLAVIASLDSKQNARAFFEDLLSETEVIILARRIQIARLLMQDFSYDDIRENLGVAYATIAGVHRWLQGGFRGYERALKFMGRIQIVPQNCVT